MEKRFIESSFQTCDPQFERGLRPRLLSEFVGQTSVVERLCVALQAAKERKEPLPHSLFCGPPGLGKTSLATILSSEMGCRIVTSSGPAIERAADLAGILTNLQEGDIFFIDEIHRLNRTLEEYLYSAMEDFSLDLMLDSGPQARSVQVQLAPFTLIGATTRMGLLSSPLRSRFGYSFRLDYYSDDDLTQIIIRSATTLAVTVSPAAARLIGTRSRGTPRIANNLLRWVRDYAQIHSNKNVDEKTAHAALAMLLIDDKGLDEMDKKILTTIIEHHQGGPVGIESIAAALGEDSSTLAEVNEPYLIMRGFLKRTPRGREVTKLAYDHLGVTQ